MNTKNITVSCPTCHKKVTWDVKHPAKPFCSERCKLIDLGEWAAEEKRIPGDPVYTEIPESDLLH
jgi:endogenous inhibitor of DNA gyrase (YacG/DUF329 family)